MLQRFKFNIAFILFFFPLQLVASNDWSDSIQAVQASRKMIWEQIIQIEKQEDANCCEKNVELVSSSGDSLFISQTLAQKLLSIDSFGRMQRIDKAFRGHHPVVHLHNLYFKSDLCLPPLDPMMETAVFFFHNLLFASGIAPSEFVFVKNVEVLRFQTSSDEKMLQSILNEQEEKLLQENQDYHLLTTKKHQLHLLQVSQMIDGDRLDSFIKNVDEGKQSLSQLNLLNFQCHFISDILLIPGDHKMENFIVESHAPMRLVNIDNDGMLFHCQVAQTSQGFAEIQPFGGCKNVIFLLKPLMAQPIDSKLRQKIINLDPHDFLSTWLSILEEQNHSIEAIFLKFPSFKERYQKNYMPFRMRPNAVSRISYELRLIQTLLREKENCSCQDLFDILRPDLAKYYAWMLNEHTTYSKAMNKLYSNERPLACGRIANVRIGPKPLKGRWIFEALDRYKKLRTQPLSESIKELQTPQMHTDEPLADRSDWREKLLKNSDDLSIRETISKHILHSLYLNQLPVKMLDLYPYGYIQEWANNQSKSCVDQNLKNFILTPKVFEDYVFFLSEEPDDIERCIHKETSL